jgi:RimJ/RimL family protein N-acetyltransferase
MITSIEFVEFDLSFLEKSFKWLSDPNIQYLTMTPNFTKETQLKWFNSLTYRINYKIWGVKYNNIPIGACGLKNIMSGKGEYWGYIGDREYWGKGIGMEMISYVEDHARTLFLIYIYLHVLVDNLRAQKLYTKMGYQTNEKIDDKVIIMMKEL